MAQMARRAGMVKMRISATGEDGFTLIELLVALAVFSLGALALVRLDSATARTTAAIEARDLARIELGNLAAELMTDPRAPSIGTEAGESANAGRRWRWTRRTEPLERDLVRIDLTVAEPGGQALATQTLVRPLE
jgi:general secretion pathway protein I